MTLKQWRTWIFYGLVAMTAPLWLFLLIVALEVTR